MLNNRELATAIWVLAFLLWGSRSPSVRKSFAGVVSSFAHPKILVPFLLSVVYVGLLVIALSRLGVWTAAQAKDTVFWFIFTGAVTAFGLIGSWKGESLFRHFTLNALKITIVIEFLTGNYTLSLPWELVLVPVLFMLGGMDAVAGDDRKYAPVKRFIGLAQIALGLMIIEVAIRDAVADWQNLRSVDSLRSLMIAPVLSVLFVPFAYGLLLYATYENLFVRLRIGAQDDPALRAYARRRLLRTFGVRLSSLRHFADGSGRRIWSVRSEAEIDALLEPSTRSSEQ